MKQAYLSDFFAKYLLTEEEDKALNLDGKNGILDYFKNFLKILN